MVKEGGRRGKEEEKRECGKTKENREMGKKKGDRGVRRG